EPACAERDAQGVEDLGRMRTASMHLREVACLGDDCARCCARLRHRSPGLRGPLGDAHEDPARGGLDAGPCRSADELLRQANPPAAVYDRLDRAAAPALAAHTAVANLD